MVSIGKSWSIVQKFYFQKNLIKLSTMISKNIVIVKIIEIIRKIGKKNRKNWQKKRENCRKYGKNC